MIHYGDCLEVLPTLQSSSVDLISCDLPYGSTYCHWDTRIDLKALWREYQRLLKPTGAILLNADFRFAVDLMHGSPVDWFRYDLIWDKVGTTGFLDANRRPLRRHEHLLVFSPVGYPTYNPQMGTGEPYGNKDRHSSASIYGSHVRTGGINDGQRFPTSILTISNANGKRRGKLHPTQKPLDLCRWIVATYSNPGETVLDNAMGSGTTGLAALELERKFIGIEADANYFEVAKKRLGTLDRPKEDQ